ncbi:DNA mismatch repair endonuclease MutL [Desulfobacterales bacterium HSG16]|nr:DNA mismatch repair endonuclease MutL [Desulfobacterales bacterium HSG16]
MSVIKILPEILSNKIAAGEVVERPASIVKELVENSLDAESTRITVEIEKGGRSLIRISDNGIGMAHDDALLSIERYATSKIYRDEDLFSIKTLGFRGEALPSIASVSKFVVETRTSSSDTGVRIQVEGGRLKDVTEAGVPAGTMITVKDLFFNIPARRKFLKTVNTEMGHIADTIASMALGWPNVRFRLIHNHKVIKNWRETSDPRERVADVLGTDVINELISIEHDENSDLPGSKVSGPKISGWIASGRVTRTTSRGIYLFVNNRYVKDKTLVHALFEGYGNRLMKGKYPLAVVFVSVDASKVDVNVHPAKTEVRFVEQRKVHDCLSSAISDALQKSDVPRWSKNPESSFESDDDPFALPEEAPPPMGRPVDFPADFPPGTLPNASTGTHPSLQPDISSGISADTPANISDQVSGQVSETRPQFQFPESEVVIVPGIQPQNRTQPQNRFPQERKSYSDPKGFSRPGYMPEKKIPQNKPAVKKERSEQERPEQERPEQEKLWETDRFRDLRIIGQFGGTYIICESEEGLVLIDQHAAHERIVFEQLKAGQSEKGAASQGLLVPETFELGFRESGILESLIPEFAKAGLEIEPFGDNTFVVRAVPAQLGEKELKPLILEIVEKAALTGIAQGLDEAFDECLKIIACHSAIRANQSLSDEQIKGLLSGMDSCKNPSYCPHGRPTWVRWTRNALEKSFNRV